MQVYYLEDFLDYILVTGQGFMSDWRVSLSDREIDIFHGSVARAQANEVFLDAFYDGFMDSSGEAQHSFSGGDMQQIKLKLHGSLKMIAQLKDDQPEDYVIMGDLPRMNAHFHVSEGMYQLWLEALLKAVSRCDPHFNNYLEEIWRHIVSEGVSHMLKRVGAKQDKFHVLAS